jgi:hypothetical protein
VECPKCKCSFHPRKIREEPPPPEEEEQGDETRPGRRGRRRRSKRPLFEDWHDPAGRKRNAKKIAGALLTVLVIGVALYFTVGRPLTSELEMDIETDAPEGIRVKVTFKKNYQWRRRRADSWEVSMKAVVTNESDKHLTIGDVQVRFFDESGDRIQSSGVSTTELLPLDSMGSGMLFLSPGRSRTYKTLFPFKFRAGFGNQRIRCKLMVKGVKPYEFVPDLKEGLRD